MTPIRPNDSVEVQRRILEFIATRVGRPVAEIPLDAKFSEVGMGSLDAIDILFAVEEEFDVIFSTEDAEAVQSARDLVALTVRMLEP
jgi:acyl carrier protein